MRGVGKMKYNKSYLARRLALSLIIGGMFVSSAYALPQGGDRKSTRLNSSHRSQSRMPSSA